MVGFQSNIKEIKGQSPPLLDSADKRAKPQILQAQTLQADVNE